MEETNEKKDKKKTIILIIILVVIIITVIACLSYQKFFKGDNEKEEIVSLETQISEYEGKEVAGAEVKLLLAKIMDNNIEDSSFALSKIEYNIKSTETGEEYSGNITLSEQSQNIQDIVKLRNEIENERIYEVEYGKENDKIVSISIKNKNS